VLALMFEIQNIIFINISMLEDKIDISSIDKLYILMKYACQDRALVCLSPIEEDRAHEQVHPQW
jgi:hypothetical protein